MAGNSLRLIDYSFFTIKDCIPFMEDFKNLMKNVTMK